MKTLIVAAGDGERLRSYTKHIPKPLIKISGKSILEIILKRCKRVGLNNFVIVTGYLGEKIKRLIKKERVKFVDNPKFNEENGHSVYCAKNILKGERRFLLLMADHIFDSNLLKKILRHKIKRGCALCIDKDLKNVFDLPSATKVYEKNGKILNIDKKLKKYNAVDTGFFLCTPDIFKILRKSLKSGFDELSDSMRLLAKKGELSAIDISGNFWIDIDTKKDLQYARKCFRKLK